MKRWLLLLALVASACGSSRDRPSPADNGPCADCATIIELCEACPYPTTGDSGDWSEADACLQREGDPAIECWRGCATSTKADEISVWVSINRDYRVSVSLGNTTPSEKGCGK